MNFRQAVQIFHQLFSTNQLIKLTGQNVYLPFYHTVSNHHLPHISHLYQLKNEQQFRADLDYLCRYFKPITLQELVDIKTTQKKIEKPVFHLTFDDGLSEVNSVVAPILEEKGIPATIFVNTGFVDNKDLFFRYKISLLIEQIITTEHLPKQFLQVLSDTISTKEKAIKKLLQFNYQDQEKIERMAFSLEVSFQDFLKNETPYLTTDEIQKLKQKGFTFGAHSVDHPWFKTLSFEDQQYQIRESMEYVNTHFNSHLHSFSFPFSDEGISTSLFNWLYEEQKCTISFGISGLKHDIHPLHLHRVPFERTTKSAKSITKTEYLYYFLKSWGNKNVVKRK